MNLFLISIALCSSTMKLVCSQQEVQSAEKTLVRRKSCDLTRAEDHEQWFPDIYRLGCQTLHHRGEVYIKNDKIYTGKILGIGRDDDAMRRWAIVANAIVEAHKTNLFPEKNIGPQCRAGQLLEALKLDGRSLDSDLMKKLKEVSSHRP